MSYSSGILGGIAVMLYLVAALSALRSMLAAREATAGMGLPQWHARVWLFAGVLFLLLAVSRQLGLEEALRAAMRGELRAERAYDDRWDIQSITAAILVVVASLSAMAGAVWTWRSGILQRPGLSRITLLAVISCGAMLMLVALRMVSMHIIDSVLYRGPRLNWIVDIGSTLAVLGLSRHYLVSLRTRARQGGRRKHSDLA
ncbi:hypothetical protein [Novosphingobium jiangmenense]|uniref:Isopropylmalate isomerase n=1 Tax=Novosphingobium jiangmenense TaxID=2791981 RepID=A0ABS0HEV4_9SPHN|nr:hypothetical protein [Novosphingobium jiangmenense]MBF9150794.1 hypothetical protein [Novosphingobium jiangmenense]